MIFKNTCTYFNFQIIIPTTKTSSYKLQEVLGCNRDLQTLQMTYIGGILVQQYNRQCLHCNSTPPNHLDVIFYWQRYYDMHYHISKHL